MTEAHALNCPLCSGGQSVIAVSEHWTIILNDNQATLGRIYFSLRRHETDITRLTSEEQSDLWNCLTAAKSVLNTLFAPEHVNFVFHMNLVAHVHAHLYPRYNSRRQFLGEVFEDVYFGRHYDPSEERILPAEISTALLNQFRAAFAAQENSGLEFNHASMERTH